MDKSKLGRDRKPSSCGKSGRLVCHVFPGFARVYTTLSFSEDGLSKSEVPFPAIEDRARLSEAGSREVAKPKLIVMHSLRWEYSSDDGVIFEETQAPATSSSQHPSFLKQEGSTH